MGRLQGKSVIITGAGSGIGRAAALLFTREGAKLIAVDRTEAVKETVEEVKKAGGIEPSRPLFRHGAGAIEIAGRYDRIRFGSNAPGEEPETNPRAVNLAENGEGIWAAGVNWYVNHWVKIQVNSMREAFEDIDRSPRPGRARFWTHIVRFQFVL